MAYWGVHTQAAEGSDFLTHVELMHIQAVACFDYRACMSQLEGHPYGVHV